MRAFCVENDAILDDAPVAAPFRLRCPRGASLQFAYTATRSRNLLIIGRGDDGRFRFYLPRPGEPALTVEAPAVDRPLGPSFRLAVNHAPGRVDVLALFSDRPLDPRAVGETLLGSLDRAAAMADNAGRLELEVMP